MAMWFGNISMKNKNKLKSVVRQGGKIVGAEQYSLDDLYLVAVRRKALAIVKDSTHPLNGQFELLPSGQRYRMSLAKRVVYKRSFVPTAVSILNSSP